MSKKENPTEVITKEAAARKIVDVARGCMKTLRKGAQAIAVSRSLAGNVSMTRSADI